jgi:hypothetical protein
MSGWSLFCALAVALYAGFLVGSHLMNWSRGKSEREVFGELLTEICPACFDAVRKRLAASLESKRRKMS